jgi:multicomponent K+:H+ antiporter subunit D
MLLVVFAVKAALLPLYFWLPDTYASAAAPVAALFAIMTKVGVYAIARTTRCCSAGRRAAGQRGAPMLPALALATLVLAALGALAARACARLVAYLVVASAGTLLLAIGLGSERRAGRRPVLPGQQHPGGGAWFLLADRIAHARGGSDRLEARTLRTGWAPLGMIFFVAAVAWPACRRWPVSWARRCCCRLPAHAAGPAGWWLWCWHPAWP